MPYKPPVAVYDACVLYPFHLRNLLVQCAVERLADARWSDAIHEEWIRNLVSRNPKLSAARLRATRDLMNRVLPGANVIDFERHIPAIALPDPDDRHVVAAGIAAGASLLVTWNVRDFPAKELGRFGIKVLTPDGFLMSLYATAPDALVAATASARHNLKTSHTTITDFITALERQNLRRFGKAIKRHASNL